MKTNIKYIIPILLCLFGVLKIEAQEVESVLIQSNNPGAIPNIKWGIAGPVSYCFDQELNTILLNYGCINYLRDYPNAPSELVRNLYRIELRGSSLYGSLMDELRALAHINEVSPIMEYYATADCDCDEGYEVDDPHLSNFMAETINLECAWEITQGSSDIQVAAVDIFPIGSENASDDLLDKLTIVPTIIPQMNNPSPGNCNHGLGIASAIAAIPDNGICTAGVGFNTTVAGYNAARTSCGSGSPRLPARQAFQDGQTIINLSWSGTGGISATEMQMWVDNGVTVVHADRGSGWSSVGNIPGVIGVGKSDTNDNYEEYDNGSCDANMDVLMPTNGIWRPTTGNSCEESGNKNSIGAGLVAGVVALIKDVNPCLSPPAIEQILETSNQGVPTDAFANQCGITAGIVDAYEAVCLAADFCADPIQLNDNICATRDCSNMLISGNLIVDAGQQLTVTGTLSFAECSHLIVRRGGRLVVDGGTLTSCGNEWRGVVVEGLTGDPDNRTGIAGKVEIINDAVIENARIGILTAREPGLPYSEDFWGGFILGDNATIRNCRRGVAFMKHNINNNLDQSSFNDVIFENIRDSGVTIWRSDGIDFTGCNFIDVGYGPSENEGILAWSAFINVTGNNQFIGCERGVVLKTSSTVARRSSTIDENLFRCERDGIYLENARSFGSRGHSLINNRFEYGRTGILVDGLSNFEILNNDFFRQNEEGIFMTGSGINENPVRDNEFEDNVRGLCYNGANGSSTFETNCFSGSFISDVEVVSVPGAEGRVRTDQLSLDLEAGNVFNDGAGEVRSNGRPINYYVWEDRPADAPQRLSAQSLATNIVELDAANPNLAENCGSPFMLAPDDDCELRMRNQEEIISLLAEIDDYLSEDQSDLDVVKAQSLKESLLLELGNLVTFSPEGDQSIIHNYLKQRPEFLSRSLVPSYLVEQGRYVEALQELNQIPNNLEDARDYKRVQRINIKFSKSGVSAVSAAELNVLNALGQQTKPSSSFARSIYHSITGNRIPVPKYYIEQDVEPRERTVQDELSVDCYPNPISSGGNLELMINSTNDDEYECTIIGMNGVVVFFSDVNANQRETISTNAFASGMYLLKINDQFGKSIHTQKVSILD